MKKLLLLAAILICSAAVYAFEQSWSFKNTTLTKIPGEQKFWKNAVAPAEWGVIDRNDRENRLSKSNDGIILNGMIATKYYPIKTGNFEIKVKARALSAKSTLKIYVMESYNNNKTPTAGAQVIIADLTKEFQEFTGYVQTVPWHPVNKMQLLMDGNDVEISDISMRKTDDVVKRQNLPAVATIPLMKEPLDLNGAFRPGYYKRNGIFIKNGFRDFLTGKNTNRQSDCYILADKDHLYLAIVYPCPPGGVVTKVKKHDGQVYLDDSVEVMINPEGDNKKPARLYQIISNFAAKVYDIEHDLAIGQHYPGWNCPGLEIRRMNYAVNDGRNHYILMMKIPFKSVKINDPSKTFGISICRNFKNPGVNGILTGTRYDDHENMLKCRVVPDAPAVGWTVYDLVGDGFYKVDLTVMSGKGPFKAEIRNGAGKVVAGKNIPANSGKTVLTVDDTGKNQRSVMYDAVLLDASGNTVFRHQNLLETNLFIKTAASKKTKVLSVEHYPFQKKINIRWNAMSKENQRDSAGAEITISGPDGKKVLKQAKIDFYENQGHAVFPFNPAVHGEYKVEAKYFDRKGNVLAVGDGSFKTKEFEWLGNKIGCDDIIVPPYTPLVVKGQTVSHLLRDFVFGKNGLPSSVKAAGGEVLASPIDLEIKTPAGVLKAKKSDFKFTKKSPTRVEFVATTYYPGLQVKLDAWMEYDGFLFYTMHLIPDSSIRIDSFAMKIPYKNALLFHYGNQQIRSNHSYYNVSEDLPGTGKIWDTKDVRTSNLRTKFLPYFWIGEHKRGLFWFAENDKGWSTKMENSGYDLYREKDGTVSMLVKFINVPVELKSAREIQFGFLATPIKPDKTGHQLSYQWDHTMGMGIMTCGFEIIDTWMTQQLVYKNPKKSHVVYLAGNLYNAGESEFKYFAHEALMKPRMNYTLSSSAVNYKIKGPNADAYFLNYVDWSPGLRDFYIWRMNTLLSKTMMDGIYLDNNYPSFDLDMQKDGKVAYLREDGFIQPGSHILIVRDFFKRLAVLGHKYNKRYPRVVLHTTAAQYLPRYTFCDVGYGGEMNIPKDGDHFQVFYSAWPEIMLGVDWGIGRGMLTMLHMNKLTATPRATRAMYAAYKISDMGLWSTATHSKTHALFQKIERDFKNNAPDCKFVMWRYNTLMKFANPDNLIRCSYFERPGKYLFYLANHSKTDRKVTFTLGKQGVLTDAETGKVIEPVNGKYTLDVKSHDLRVLLLKTK